MLTVILVKNNFIGGLGIFKYFPTTIVLSIGSFLSLFAEIHRVDNLDDIKQNLPQLDQNSLVLIDVDCTLIIFDDAILHPSGQKAARKFITEILENPSIVPQGKYPDGYLNSKIISKATSSLLDDKFLSFVKDLQNNSIPTIAFTAAPTGELGVIRDMCDWRVNELKKFGFDFTSAFPNKPYLELSKKDNMKYVPVFKSGVLFTAWHSKGDVLKEFLHTIDWRPTKIILIDDRMKYLESVESTLNQMGIDFIGFHYTAAEKLPTKLDEALGEFQFKYLAENGEWLSDKEAKSKVDSQMDTKTEMNVQSFLEEYIGESNGVGAAVGFIEGERVNFFTFGKESVLNPKPINTETIFEIGSITKVFTTLILMDLVEKEEISLDDPIEIYLLGKKIPDFNGKKILLRDLATHYSGLPCIPDNFTPKNPNNPYLDYSVDDIYTFLAQYDLKRAPGVEFEYSNLGMGLLGEILTKKTGKSYEELVKSCIGDKLLLNKTKIFLSENEKKHFAAGHLQKSEVEHWDIISLAGCGGLRSDIKDMTNFLKANMGLIESSTSRLLKKCHQKQYDLSPDCSIGLGWMITKTDDGDFIWHNGGTGGFRTFLGFNTKTKKGVVVLANSAEEWPDAFAMNLLDPKRYSKPQIDESLAKDQCYLKKFEGDYKSISLSDQCELDSNISLKDGRLIYSCTAGEIELLPVSSNSFALKGIPGQKLEFLINKNNKIVKANWRMSDEQIVGEVLPKGVCYE